MKEPEMPKDLQLEMGTKDHAFWKATKEKAESELLQNEREAEINRLIIEHADSRIAEEKEKFK